MRALLIGFLFLTVAGCAQPAPQAVRAAHGALSTPGLDPLVAAIPPASLPDYGLPSHAALDRATLGPAYEMLSPRPKSAGTWEQAVMPLGVWRRPLMLDGDAIALVTVTRQQGVERAVELGAAALARELGAIKVPPETTRRAILRVHRLGADFLVTVAGSARQILPLRSARRALKLDLTPMPEQALLNLLAGDGR